VAIACTGRTAQFSGWLKDSAMDFELNEDERAIEDAARRFARERLAPFAAEWDEREFFPVETLREAWGSRGFM
jgi:alkylation response protein AidB-like acyl-CoA dehydrogenase